MLKANAKLRGNLDADLKKLEIHIRERVCLSGAAAMARVLYKEAEGYAAAHHKTGLLESAIRRRYIEKRSINKQTYWVSWNPKVAPHGHFLEYGTSRAPAYPFIAPAFGHINEAIAAGKAQMKKKMSEMHEGGSGPAGGAEE